MSYPTLFHFQIVFNISQGRGRVWLHSTVTTCSHPVPASLPGLAVPSPCLPKGWDTLKGHGRLFWASVQTLHNRNSDLTMTWSWPWFLKQLTFFYHKCTEEPNFKWQNVHNFCVRLWGLDTIGETLFLFSAYVFWALASFQGLSHRPHSPWFFICNNIREQKQEICFIS